MINDGSKLDFISLVNIDLGERARTEYTNIEELILSIEKNGLIQPIAVLKRGDRDFLLLAGGRRFTACARMDWKAIPARIYTGPLTSNEIKMIELTENMDRVDLSYRDQFQLTREIHDLQVAIHGGDKTSTASDAEGWSQADTARLLGKSKGTISEALKMAKAIEAIPELGEVKNKKEAMKILQQTQQSVRRTEDADRLRSRVDTTPTDTVHRNLINQYILKDAKTGMVKLKSGTFKMAEVDPPYAIDLVRVKKKDDFINEDLATYQELTDNTYVEFMTDAINEIYRVLSVDSWLILWHAYDWGDALFDICENAGFIGSPVPAIWTKGVGQTNRPELYLASTHEPFFYMRKGHPRIVKQGRSNIFDFKPVNPDSKRHPTERPIEMMEEIISTFVEQGSPILVPFAGSGNTILAAANLCSTAIGYDVEDPYKDSYIIKVSSTRPPHYKSYRKDYEKT